MAGLIDEDRDHALEGLTFAEAHQRVGVGSRLPGESPEDSTRADAAHWVRVYTELVHFKRKIVAVVKTSRRDLSFEARLEGAADEALIGGQLQRYERRLEEWETARDGFAPSPSHGDGELRIEGPVRSVSGLTVDPRQRAVVLDGHRVEMTPSEWKLLRVFLEHPGQTLTRERIAARAWGAGYASRAGEVEVYVSRLRRKIASPGNPSPIQTVRGAGYRLILPDPAVTNHDHDGLASRGVI